MNQTNRQLKHTCRSTTVTLGDRNSIHTLSSITSQPAMRLIAPLLFYHVYRGLEQNASVYEPVEIHWPVPQCFAVILEE